MPIDIFDIMYERYKINKPIRLIELFGGYGSQALALKYLGVKYESYKLCEWAIKSIQAYKDIHFTNDNTDYSKDLTKDEIIDYLFNLGISSNYNEPMELGQIKRIPEGKIRTIYNNIKATHNLVNIQQAKGNNFEIVDKDKYEYIMTYSFPCQDLSLAGKRAGMEKDSGTRSGMLWEVERILDELNVLSSLPQILLMENVPQVHGTGNKESFNYWCNKLESLGYKNYWKDLIATDYGIPQTRNRTFMISILGEYKYSFPEPIPLKLKLKDMLEDEVDEKYYLSDKMINYIFSKNDKYIVNENSLKINRDIACSKTTREGNTRADTSDYVTDNIEAKVIGGIGDKKSNNNTQWYQQDRIYDNNVSIAVTTSFNPNYIDNNLRIRKLTPKECFRLMGVKDKDFDNVSKNQSNASLYHLAGDSLITTIMMALFSQMLDINWQEHFNNKEWWNND